jgi:hypothetical protein
VPHRNLIGLKWSSLKINDSKTRLFKICRTKTYKVEVTVAGKFISR